MTHWLRERRDDENGVELNVLELRYKGGDHLLHVFSEASAQTTPGLGDCLCVRGIGQIQTLPGNVVAWSMVPA